MQFSDPWNVSKNSENEKQRGQFLPEDNCYFKRFNCQKLAFEIDYRHYHLKISVKRDDTNSEDVVVGIIKDELENGENLSSQEFDSTSIQSDDYMSHKKHPQVLETPILGAERGQIMKSAVDKYRCKIFFYYIYHLVPEAHPKYEVDSDEYNVTNMKLATSCKYTWKNFNRVAANV